MELYEYARPELMSGKKILYVHGFASSGASGTVKTLETLLPEAKIIAPDLPVEPEEAVSLLKTICVEEEPNLIIGTSMGGMYAEMLAGYDRILVNPAFTLADTVLKNNGLGRQEFHSPRKDGQTSFLVTKGLLEEFRKTTSNCFGLLSSDRNETSRVYGLFGLHDEMVDTYDIFASHYPNAIRFNGGHYLNDETLLHSVLPVIQWIDDKQENREKQVVIIAMDDTLADVRTSEKRLQEDVLKDYEGHLHDYPRYYSGAEPVNSAVKCFSQLARYYDVYISASLPHNSPSQWGGPVSWADEYLGVAAWNRVICCPRKDLLLGDYLIDAHPEFSGGEDFMGTLVPFATEHFRKWEDVLTYFDRLDGR